MNQPMQILIQSNGNARCVYGEAVDLAALGTVDIRRGSHVEPNDNGEWMADLSPVGGRLLGPFNQRSDALKAEVDWLTKYWLTAARK